MPIVKNSSGHEIVSISNLAEATIHVDGLEALQTTANTHLDGIHTKMPSALTGSGNLKVSIQELGNEGSERLNVDVGAVLQLPTQLTGEGNLKVSIQEDHTHNLALEATQSAMSAKLPSVLDNDALKVKVMAGGTPAITGFNLEATQTAMSAKLPTALTGSGNLKVCIQELGNEGSERLNVDVGDDITQLPTQLTGDGNLKVSIEEGATSAITGFNLESTQTAMSAKISKGEASTITGGTGGLQQMLLYGRESGGNLRALECVGDRLITTDLVFGASGPNEPTSLAKIAIHGQINDTNSYKNLRVSTEGVLSTDKVLKVVETQTASVLVISGDSEGSLEINTTGYSKVRISGVSSTSDELILMCSSTSGGTLMEFDTIQPSVAIINSSGGVSNVFSKLIECPPSFIKIRNPTSYDISITASNIKTIV